LSYQNKFTSDEANVIAIDFDGVIHNHHLGYHDGTIYGDPIEGSLESIEALFHKGYDIVLYSCKCHPERPLVDSKTGIQLIYQWLEERGVKKFVKDVVWGKPHALIYIDDKGYRFENWNSTICFLNEEFFKKGENNTKVKYTN